MQHEAACTCLSKMKRFLIKILSVSLFWTLKLSKPSLKIGSVNKVFCFDIDNGLKNIFFYEQNFFVFQDRKLKLSASVWKRISCNLTKFQLNQKTDIKKMKITIVWMSWMSWNFVRFHEILFQTDAETFSFLSWKTKKFYS